VEKSCTNFLFEEHVAKQIVSKRRQLQEEQDLVSASAMSGDLPAASESTPSQPTASTQTPVITSSTQVHKTSVAVPSLVPKVSSQKVGVFDKSPCTQFTAEHLTSSALNNDELLKHLGTVKTGASELLIALVDYGGQSVFTPLHHLAITEKSVYLVVFNMQWLLTPDETVKRAAINYLVSWIETVILMHGLASFSLEIST
jgi:hypothetical protein